MNAIRLNKATFIVANSLERRTLDGKNYAVAPCIAIVEGVLNAEFVGRDVIAASVPGWNGRPVPLRHPQVNGVYVSANDPSIFEEYVIGVVYNAEFLGDRLSVELWIDEEKCQRMGGDALAVLNRLESGEPLEVSTGYFCEATPAAGKWNNEVFTAVQAHIVPDHIAVLPDQVGACSWNDGCGAPRVNADAGSQCSCGGDHMKKNRLVQGPPPAVKVATIAASGEIVAAATVTGDTEVEVVITEAPEAEVETPVEDAGNGDITPDVEDDQEDESPEGDAAATASDSSEENGAEAPSAEPATNADDIDEITKLAKLVNENGGIEQVNYLLWSLLDLQWMVEEIGGVDALEAVLATIKNNVKDAKAEVIAKIRGNANCEFSEAELLGMTLVHLEKLDRSMRSNNYGGKAAPPVLNTLKPYQAPSTYQPRS